MKSSTDLKFQRDIARVKHNDPNLTSFLFDFQNSVGRPRLRLLADALRSNDDHISHITFVNTTPKDQSSDYRLRTDHVSALEEALLINHHCALQTIEVKMDFASTVAAMEFGKLIRRGNGIDNLHVSASSGIDDSTVIIEALAHGLATPPEEDEFDSEGGLTKLKLSHFDLDRDAIDVLCFNIVHQEESRIKFVDLSGNNFTVRGDLLGEALFGSKSCLETVAIGKNEEFWLGMFDPSFFSKLAYNTTLDTLLLVDMGYFSTRQAAALADALCHNTTLQELHIEDNAMNEVELLALTPIFRHNTSLERFSLVGNNIGDLEAISFAEAMCDNSAATNLNYLALNENCIGEFGAEALAEMLRECKTMKSLSLTNNEIDDLGAMHIANAISQSRTIEEIHLDENINIGIEGEEALLRSLRRNMSLQRFSMRNDENHADRTLEVNDEIDKCLRMNKLAKKLIKPDWDKPIPPALFCDRLAFLTTSDKDHEAKGQVGKVFSVLRARMDILVSHMPS
jgi:Ran GTPase-activating protein (RanGAP) involved in mRNA processing and transport